MRFICKKSLQAIANTYNFKQTPNYKQLNKQTNLQTTYTSKQTCEHFMNSETPVNKLLPS